MTESISTNAVEGNRKFKRVGTRPIRHDGVDKVTGRANFGADFTLPGMLHGSYRRSEHAHAKILDIDTSRAEALPGVHAVVTSRDLPPIPSEWIGGPAGMDPGELSANMLARDKVLYHGHAIAAVAAATPELARHAASLIDVEYEVLEPVLTIDRALSPDAPILHPDQAPRGFPPLPEGPTNVTNRIPFADGDVAAGFAEADVVVEHDFEVPMVHQGYIEPHACVVSVKQDGRAEIWCCTQGAFMVKACTATVLEMDPALIKVTPSEIGGGFGGKTTIYLEPVALVLSRKSGRPVKLVMTREEVFRATGPNPGAKLHLKVGARNDGTLVAVESTVIFESGAFRNSAVAAVGMTMTAPYRIPNFLIECVEVVLNKPRVVAYRAPGAPIGAFAMEQTMDELAARLGRDPIDLRLQNACVEGDRAPYGIVYSRIGLVETLEEAHRHSHWSAPLGPNQGRGVACGFWFNGGEQSSATVSLNTDGSAVVRTGNPDIGGSRASMALMAAEELGLEVERVRPMVGDTDSVGYCDPTGGSRVTYTTGMAVIEASRSVVEDLRARAALIWDCDLDAVSWDDGRAIRTQGGDDVLTLGELAAQMGATGGPVIHSASVHPPAAGLTFGTHLCDVEVDPETGQTRVIRYTVVQDAGKAVHPTYVEGQMQGGAVQGIGWALNEEYLFDEEGRLENAGFLDYRMPVASDLPMIDTVIVEVPCEMHPYGVRGVGEAPIVPPLAAVANAVAHATGVRFLSLPLSPPRVLEGIEQAVGRGAA